MSWRARTIVGLDEKAWTSERASAAQHFAALLAGVVERGFVLANGGGADQRAHERLRVQRVADADLLVTGDQAPLDLVDPRCVDQQSARRRAALSGGADRAEQNRGHHQVKVGVLVDDDGVVATELEQAAAKASRDALADASANVRGSGKAHEGNTLVVHEAARKRVVRRDE